MESNLKLFVLIVTSCNLLLAVGLFVKLRQPTTMVLWTIKILISALSPVFFLVGIVAVILAGIVYSAIGLVLGGAGVMLYVLHMIAVTRPPLPVSGFDRVFGKDYIAGIPKTRKALFLRNRYAFLLPKTPDPLFEEDIVFHTIPSSNRELLCDVWQPAEHIKRSGLAFIYLHGSAWSVWDKNKGTRRFFCHLAAQGHVIMDVAYRLYPETDMRGMVEDALRAIAWMKANAKTYRINPNRIVIGGGSAGGHLALIAGYTAFNKDFLPEDLSPSNVSVKGIISLYGPTDLKAAYYHCRQDLTDSLPDGKQKKRDSGAMPLWMQKLMGENYHRLGLDKEIEPGMLTPMLGGNPTEKPEIYARFSPITYVNEDCPITLLIQGGHDILIPPEATNQLFSNLVAKKVPAILHVLPQTDHAFDLILPKLSPSAHNAIFDVERFLGILATKNFLGTDPEEEMAHHLPISNAT